LQNKLYVPAIEAQLDGAERRWPPMTVATNPITAASKAQSLTVKVHVCAGDPFYELKTNAICGLAYREALRRGLCLLSPVNRDAMMDDAMWTQDLISALHSENLFISQQVGSAETSVEIDLKPTCAETERAVANIRSWRTYLPAACVVKMIDEGWQWST